MKDNLDIIFFIVILPTLAAIWITYVFINQCEQGKKFTFINKEYICMVVNK